MDALELLTQDHDRVKRSFTRIRNAKGSDARRLFREVKAELDQHSRIEETIFYPAFEKYEEVRDLIHRCQEHHKEFEALLEESSPSMDRLFQMVEDHIQEEERELFPQIRKLMKRPEREHLGRLLSAAKSEGVAAA